MMRRMVIVIAALLNLAMVAAVLACSAGGEEASTTPADGRQSGATATPATTGAASTGAAAGGTLLFGIGMHIEPLGAEVSQQVGAAVSPRPAPGPDYRQGSIFERHIQDIRTVAAIVERYSGRMTVQTQTPFTQVAVTRNETILRDLAAAGHEIALHFHEDAHLGPNGNELSSETWCNVMKEEIGFIREASGVDVVRYWSGGNLYAGLLDAASCAGLDVNSDWKNPYEQQTASELIGTEPWRPAGGTDGNDTSRFAAHDPRGPVVFLPEGQYGRTDFGGMRRSETAGGDAAYFDFLKQSLMDSLAQAQADPTRVHVFHFTVHPGEFRGADPDHPFQVIERFIAEVVDPLVQSGEVQWATFSQMADAYRAWESANPGAAPRGEA